MPKFNNRSKTILSTTHSDLQLLFNEVIKVRDCSVISGFRGMLEQNRLYQANKSDLCYPNSTHNVYPSNGVDVIPFPNDWEDIERFKEFVVLVKKIAKRLNINIECGGDWESPIDYPHFQRVEV